MTAQAYTAQPIWKTPAGGEAVLARYRQFLGHWPGEQITVPTAYGDTFVLAVGPKDAPAVVMLHGSGSNAITWAPDAALMAPHLRVYAVDIIGEPGLSAPSRPPLRSDAYVAWLDEVLAGLGVEKAALVGISLGGWMALEYATTRPERVGGLALLCPGGVGRGRNVLLWAAPLMLLGPWGRRLALRKALGLPKPAGPLPPAAQAYADFMALVGAQFRYRREALPCFSDARLARLTMPVLAILGAKDAMLDSAGTRAALERTVPRLDLRWLPEAGHMLSGHAATIAGFLKTALAP